MAVKLIDRAPPMETGNPVQDTRAILDYLAYLREQINYILSLQGKMGGNQNGK